MKSVIMQVDESTKGLMEEIQSGISSSIEDGISEVKTTVERLSDQGRSINSIIESVKRLEEKQSATSTDLQNAIARLETRCASLTEQQTQDIIEALKSEVSSAQAASHEEFSNVQAALSDVKAAISSVNDNIADSARKLETAMEQIASAQQELAASYAANEAAHAEFENNAKAELKQLGDSVEKLQATLDIVENLVTPFWKKWNKHN